MKQELEQAIAAAVKELFGVELSIELSRPDEQFGDFATNAALQLSKQLGKNPREIAEELAVKLREAMTDTISDVSVAGPGFLNLTLADEALMSTLGTKPIRSLEGQKIVFEYSDPNPFKVLHAGHLYQTVIGDAIANLLTLAGAEVHKVNFGGDVGLHVGKTMWAILDSLSDHTMDEATAREKLQAISQKQLADRSAWLAEQYIKGNNAYESDESLKQAVVAINKRVYGLHSSNDHASDFAVIYWTCREWSYDYFKDFYAKIGSGFERYYPESETAPIGLKVVQEELAKGVYEESDGAVVFKGEPYGLHTRVFINSEGLPTYEAKDVGLTMAKWRDYHFDRTIIITGNDIVQYMKVVLKSIEQFEPELVQRTTHLTHGQVKLAGGTKMSSRKGNIVRAQDILDAAAQAGQELSLQTTDVTVLGAVKYAFNKQSLGPDVIYEPKESISLQGNSGPYLQYAHARARSILGKAQTPVIPASEPEPSEQNVATGDTESAWIPGPPVFPTGRTGQARDDSGEQKAVDLEPGERSLVRKLSEYTEVVERAIDELMPHHICGYLYELAQTFNRFYEHNRVIDDPREAIRLQLVSLYADTLKDGLTLLGITAPDKM